MVKSYQIMIIGLKNLNIMGYDMQKYHKSSLSGD